jgi:TPR repeat protein
LSALKSSCLTPLPFSYESPRLEQPLPSFKPQDDFKALKFYQKACDLNLGVSCSQLGFMYEKGKGVKQDDLKIQD